MILHSYIPHFSHTISMQHLCTFVPQQNVVSCFFDSCPTTVSVKEGKKCCHWPNISNICRAAEKLTCYSNQADNGIRIKIQVVKCDDGKDVIVVSCCAVVCDMQILHALIREQFQCCEWLNKC